METTKKRRKVVEETGEILENGNGEVKKSPFGLWSSKTVQSKKWKILLYGPSGAGKTSFAATFPNPLFLDLEGGLRSTVRIKPVLRYPSNPNRVVSSFKSVHNFYKLVKETKNPDFDTIVVDSLNELQILITKHIVSEFDATRMYEDQLTYSDYGKMGREFINIIRDFISLPYNIIFTAIETPREYEDQQVYPKFVGKMVWPDLQRIIEMIGYCKTTGKGDKLQHVVNFELSETHIAKSRVDLINTQFPNDYESLIRNQKKYSIQEENE